MRLRRLTRILAPGAVFLAFLALAGLASAAPSTLTINLTPLNNSGESGTATLTDMGNGKTQVVVTMQGAPAGVTQPIHIHEGTCSTLNPNPKYPLTSLQNGKSETTVDVSIADLLASPFAINVHKSQQDVSVYVSCGNITQTASTPSAPPNTGAGALAARSSLAWAGGMGLAIVAIVGGAYALRRRA
ncbi:MAG TPA: hypothetical protein VFW96_01060 [Thermomicrobiales bacterium]|nr:hypothetical protein [Thermomicrobiales bacterium]